MRRFKAETLNRPASDQGRGLNRLGGRPQKRDVGWIALRPNDVAVIIGDHAIPAFNPLYYPIT